MHMILNKWVLCRYLSFYQVKGHTCGCSVISDFQVTHYHAVSCVPSHACICICPLQYAAVGDTFNFKNLLCLSVLVGISQQKAVSVLVLSKSWFCHKKVLLESLKTTIEVKFISVRSNEPVFKIFLLAGFSLFVGFLLS